MRNRLDWRNEKQHITLTNKDRTTVDALLAKGMLAAKTWYRR